MVKTALVVIDLQNDFINGSLAVPGAQEIVPNINWLAQQDWDLVVATRDWHPANHTSFASQHGVAPFTLLNFVNPMNLDDVKPQTVWADHCVQNTNGAELAPLFQKVFDGLKTPHYLVSKGYLVDREYYSAFQDTWGLSRTELAKILRENSIKKVVFCGLALDYCVYHSALDCAWLGFDTVVYTDYCRAIDLNIIEEKLQDFRQAGVTIENGPPVGT